VVHAAYWKYVVSRRLSGQQRGSFRLKGSNWFERPQDGTEQEWRADIAPLDRMHRSLRDAVDGLTANALRQKPKGSTIMSTSIVAGVAAHDVYHAGRIQLLKTLLSQA
jgi:hypothetical protein